MRLKIYTILLLVFAVARAFAVNPSEHQPSVVNEAFVNVVTADHNSVKDRVCMSKTLPSNPLLDSQMPKAINHSDLAAVIAPNIPGAMQAADGLSYSFTGTLDSFVAIPLSPLENLQVDRKRSYSLIDTANRYVSIFLDGLAKPPGAGRIIDKSTENLELNQHLARIRVRQLSAAEQATYMFTNRARVGASAPDIVFDKLPMPENAAASAGVDDQQHNFQGDGCG